MTRHGRLSLPLPRAVAAAALCALLALLIATLGAERAAAAPAGAAVCTAADCPSTGAPQQLTFSAPAASAGERSRGPALLARPARLHVAVSGVPAGRTATVVVTSPRGRRWRIARTRTFRPRVPGRWTVTGQRIVREDVTLFPKHRSSVVQVRRGGRGTIRVAYVQSVANETAVAPARAIKSFERDGGRLVLTVADPQRKIAAGGVVAAGVSEATPQGALIAVSSVRRSGTTAVVTGTQAPLSAIGPQARITVRPELTLGQDGLARASAAQPGAVEKPYKCSGGVSASINGSVGLDAGAEIGISWGGFWHPLTVKAIAAARLRQSAQLSLVVAGKAKCELDVDLLKRDIRYSPITFTVGPVPVVITPKLNFRVFAEGSVQGAVETSVRQSLDARVGLEWDGDDLIPIKSVTNRTSFTPPKPQFDASIEAGLGPRLMFDVYEVGGPYITGDALARFDVSSHKNPWWRLSAGFQAGAGIKFKVWKFTFNRHKPDLLSKLWTLAEAKGAAPPSVTQETLPGAVAGTPYRTTLTVTRGTKPIAWSVSAGTLPAGLTLNPSSGLISGTPAATGTASFTVKATDAQKQVATRALKLAVAAPAPSIAPASLPAATLGAPYRAQVTGTGSTTPYAWSVSAGALPAGLSLDPRSGLISGVPSATGTASFTVALSGGDGQRATRAYAVKVEAAPLSIPQQTLPGATVDAAYTASLSAEGGVAPHRWAVTAGALPAGLTLADDGRLTGTPTAPVSATFTVTVTDADGTSASRELTLTAAYPALSVPQQALLAPMAGQAYSAQLRADGGGAPLTWSVSAGAPPAGLSLAGDGTLAGTPTTVGPSTFTVTVLDRYGQEAERELTLTVVPNAVEVVTATLPGARVGTAYAQTLDGRGGRAPYTWSLAAGSSLPTGLTLDPSTGAISGTPTTAGSRTFTVRVADADGVTATRSLSIAVAGNTPQDLRSVACPTDTFCMVGDLGGGIVTFDGTSWGDREVVVPGDIAQRISCATATDCLVVTWNGRTKVWSGGTWTSGPDVPSEEFSNALSCITATNCFLGGQAAGARAAVWHWDGSSWTAPDDAVGAGRAVSGVSCPTATFCAAAIGNVHTVSFWNGATWETPVSPGIFNGSSLGCTADRRCVLTDATGQGAFYSGGTWSSRRIGSGSNDPAPVGCSRTASFCAYAFSGDGGSLFTWGATSTEAAGRGRDVAAVACSSADLCVAVGPGGVAQRWDGTSWVDEGVIAAG
ncbi:Ig domain-containing protein [Conexibacter woesei]|uniref:Ig family protein n=1 Tax=Conexibacter woesei (strain DSM 14684 / CCUG 47730 / CIP 108061 / JCM 11494 / NBRC 100937 / ID131577) TaxID=469383 RepID=D3F817_CONWI|nr:Ig domain-containing protein [Conexibacter woesei]ADB52911.1 Ig family protein [Conexibacter woesei DSM 14684]